MLRIRAIEFPIPEDKLLHEATHQLQFWTRRQRAEWGKPQIRQDWFDDGQAETLSAVEASSAGTLEFTGLNRVRLRSLQGTWKSLEQRRAEYPFFGLGKLVFFRSFREAQTWAATERGLSTGLGVTLFFDQAWALTYFLHHGEDGRYRDGYLKLCDLALVRSWGEGGPEQAFRTAFGIETEKQLEAFDYAFRRYVTDHLMKLEVGE